MSTISRIVPGRFDTTATRSPSEIASSMLWVMNTTVCPSLDQTFELALQDLASHGVEGTERFVGQKHPGLGHHGPGNADPLSHATGQLVGIRLLEAAQPTLAMVSRALPGFVL